MGFLDIYKDSQSYKIIKKDLSLGMLNHSYMIVSTDEYLINEFAMYIAKTILCVGKDNPCDECLVCQKISHGNYFDLNVYPKEGHDRIDRDATLEIIDDILVKPIDGDYKVVILKNIDDTMDVSIQNKLLKTLEEPPKNVVFIMTTTNEYSVLNTVKSRAKKIYEHSLPSSVVVDYLVEVLGVEPEMAIKIGAMSGGSITKATKLSKNKHSIDMLALIFEMLENMRSSANVLYYSAKVATFKDLDEFLNMLLVVFRDILVASVDVDKVEYTFYVDTICKLTAIYSPRVCVNVRERIELAIQKLNANCNKNSVIDGVLFDILEVKYLCQK